MKVSLQQAISLLNKGQVVGVPTETVYGLAATVDNELGIDQIFSLKNRPANNPLIIHVAAYAHILPFLKREVEDLELLAKRFWPGPLTIVLPIKPELILPKVRAHLKTAAFRIPSHPLTLQLIEETGPLVMPSANLSGKPSATIASHVENDFGLSFPVLDGGASSNGLESTIIIYRDANWEIIRQGSISKEQFVSTLGYEPPVHKSNDSEKPICPGQMYRHYAPKATLHLKNNFEGPSHLPILGFSDKKYLGDSPVIFLGSLKNPKEIAANLYKVLRDLDENNIAEVFVDMDFPEEGLFATIKERLLKASIKN